MGTKAASFVLTFEVIAIFLTQVQSLDLKDPLEKELAAHSSILAWEIPWKEEPGRLQPMALQNVRYHSATKSYTNTHTSAEQLKHININSKKV